MELRLRYGAGATVRPAGDAEVALRKAFPGVPQDGTLVVLTKGPPDPEEWRGEVEGWLPVRRPWGSLQSVNRLPPAFLLWRGGRLTVFHPASSPSGE